MAPSVRGPRVLSAWTTRRAGGDRTTIRPVPGTALFLVALLVLMVPLVGGCTISMALDTTVEADGSGTVGVRLAADKEILDLMASQGAGADDLFSEFRSGVPEGWESDSGTEEDGSQWVTASRSFDQISELETLLRAGSESPAENLGVETFTLTQESSWFSVKTTFSATWDLEEALAASEEGLPSGVDVGALSSIFDIQNRLTLPGSVKDNNADSVEGSTLTWRPSLAGATEMHATSVVYRWPIIGGLAGAVLVILAVIALVVVSTRRRSKGMVPLAAALEPTDAQSDVAEETQAPPGT